ncbi:hypothetical protein BESB_047830 [Besnoitia besnoiti]|uniref:Uncharacterized protein n=1 Tax=Besnoitia besnoiti TaxID=94643 RepID=A0A2A9MK07_BESBE|nr:hypothetical protein BESB_047830 [Besnoitia besnoiti]PFH36591.1 hypothetical protein BESB_047830 [Besnoitia besnoiti]
MSQSPLEPRDERPSRTSGPADDRVLESARNTADRLHRDMAVAAAAASAASVQISEPYASGSEEEEVLIDDEEYQLILSPYHAASASGGGGGDACPPLSLSSPLDAPSQSGTSETPKFASVDTQEGDESSAARLPSFSSVVAAAQKGDLPGASTTPVAGPEPSSVLSSPFNHAPISPCASPCVASTSRATPVSSESQQTPSLAPALSKGQPQAHPPVPRQDESDGAEAENTYAVRIVVTGPARWRGDLAFQGSPAMLCSILRLTPCGEEPSDAEQAAAEGTGGRESDNANERPRIPKWREEIVLQKRGWGPLVLEEVLIHSRRIQHEREIARDGGEGDRFGGGKRGFEVLLLHFHRSVDEIPLPAEDSPFIPPSALTHAPLSVLCLPLSALDLGPTEAKYRLTLPPPSPFVLSSSFLLSSFSPEKLLRDYQSVLHNTARGANRCNVILFSLKLSPLLRSSSASNKAQLLDLHTQTQRQRMLLASTAKGSSLSCPFVSSSLSVLQPDPRHRTLASSDFFDGAQKAFLGSSASAVDCEKSRSRVALRHRSVVGVPASSAGLTSFSALRLLPSTLDAPQQLEGGPAAFRSPSSVVSAPVAAPRAGLFGRGDPGAPRPACTQEDPDCGAEQEAERESPPPEAVDQTPSSVLWGSPSEEAAVSREAETSLLTSEDGISGRSKEERMSHTRKEAEGGTADLAQSDTVAIHTLYSLNKVGAKLRGGDLPLSSSLSPACNSASDSRIPPFALAGEDGRLASSLQRRLLHKLGQSARAGLPRLGVRERERQSETATPLELEEIYPDDSVSVKDAGGGRRPYVESSEEDRDSDYERRLRPPSSTSLLRGDSGRARPQGDCASVLSCSLNIASLERGRERLLMMAEAVKKASSSGAVKTPTNLLSLSQGLSPLLRTPSRDACSSDDDAETHSCCGSSVTLRTDGRSRKSTLTTSIKRMDFLMNQAQLLLQRRQMKQQQKLLARQREEAERGAREAARAEEAPSEREAEGGRRRRQPAEEDLLPSLESEDLAVPQPANDAEAASLAVPSTEGQRPGASNEQSSEETQIAPGEGSPEDDLGAPGTTEQPLAESAKGNPGDSTGQTSKAEASFGAGDALPARRSSSRSGLETVEGRVCGNEKKAEAPEFASRADGQHVAREETAAREAVTTTTGSAAWGEDGPSLEVPKGAEETLQETGLGGDGGEAALKSPDTPARQTSEAFDAKAAGKCESGPEFSFESTSCAPVSPESDAHTCFPPSFSLQPPPSHSALSQDLLTSPPPSDLPGTANLSASVASPLPQDAPPLPASTPQPQADEVSREFGDGVANAVRERVLPVSPDEGKERDTHQDEDFRAMVEQLRGYMSRVEQRLSKRLASNKRRACKRAKSGASSRANAGEKETAFDAEMEDAKGAKQQASEERTEGDSLQTLPENEADRERMHLEQLAKKHREDRAALERLEAECAKAREDVASLKADLARARVEKDVEAREQSERALARQKEALELAFAREKEVLQERLKVAETAKCEAKVRDAEREAHAEKTDSDEKRLLKQHAQRLAAAYGALSTKVQLEDALRAQSMKKREDEIRALSHRVSEQDKLLKQRSEENERLRIQLQALLTDHRKGRGDDSLVNAAAAKRADPPASASSSSSARETEDLRRQLQDAKQEIIRQQQKIQLLEDQQRSLAICTSSSSSLSAVFSASTSPPAPPGHCVAPTAAAQVEALQRELAFAQKERARLLVLEQQREKEKRQLADLFSLQSMRVRELEQQLLHIDEQLANVLSHSTGAGSSSSLRFYSPASTSVGASRSGGVGAASERGAQAPGGRDAQRAPERDAYAHLVRKLTPAPPPTDRSPASPASFASASQERRLRDESEKRRSHGPFAGEDGAQLRPSLLQRLRSMRESIKHLQQQLPAVLLPGATLGGAEASQQEAGESRGKDGDAAEGSTPQREGGDKESKCAPAAAPQPSPAFASSQRGGAGSTFLFPFRRGNSRLVLLTSPQGPLQGERASQSAVGGRRDTRERTASVSRMEKRAPASAAIGNLTHTQETGRSASALARQSGVYTPLVPAAQPFYERRQTPRHTPRSCSPSLRLITRNDTGLVASPALAVPVSQERLKLASAYSACGGMSSFASSASSASSVAASSVEGFVDKAREQRGLHTRLVGDKEARRGRERVASGSAASHIRSASLSLLQASVFSSASPRRASPSPSSPASPASRSAFLPPSYVSSTQRQPSPALARPATAAYMASAAYPVQLASSSLTGAKLSASGLVPSPLVAHAGSDAKRADDVRRLAPGFYSTQTLRDATSSSCSATGFGCAGMLRGGERPAREESPRAASEVHHLPAGHSQAPGCRPASPAAVYRYATPSRLLRR